MLMTYPRFGKFLVFISLNKLSTYFSFSCPSGTPIILILDRVSKISQIFFALFHYFFFVLQLFYFKALILQIIDSVSRFVYSATDATAFFIPFIEFFNSRISVWFFFMSAVSLLNFSFYLCIIFLIQLNRLSVFSCSSFHFFKTAILNFLSAILQHSVSQSSVARGLL